LPSVWFLPRNVWRTVVIAQKSSGEVVLSVVAEGGAAGRCSENVQIATASWRKNMYPRAHDTIWERVHFFPCMQCMMLVNHFD
jgi:hypothetical protein